MHFVVLRCLSTTIPAHTQPCTAAGYVCLVGGRILPLPGWQSCRSAPSAAGPARSSTVLVLVPGRVTRCLRTRLGGSPWAVHHHGAETPRALLFAASLAPQMDFVLLWAGTVVSWGQIQTSTARETPHTKPQRGPAARTVLHPSLPGLP